MTRNVVSIEVALAGVKVSFGQEEEVALLLPHILGTLTSDVSQCFLFFFFSF